MKNENNGTENVEIDKKMTKEQLYAKYCLMAKMQIDKESLAKKQNKLSGWLLVLWILLILITLLIYFFMSGFSVQAFRELTGYGLGYWTVAGAVFLGLIFILVVATMKPDFIILPKIFKKADELIENKKKSTDAAIKEFEVFKEL